MQPKCLLDQIPGRFLRRNLRGNYATEINIRRRSSVHKRILLEGGTTKYVKVAM